MGDKLTEYMAAIADDEYKPSEEVIAAVRALDPTDPVAQEALADLEQQMQDSGLTLAITSGDGGDSASYTMVENSNVVTTVLAKDPQDDPVTYSISGGADAGLFEIDAVTGELRFIGAPNFESPGSADGDNFYDVTVMVSDADSGQTDSQDITVEVLDINDAPVAADDTATTDENAVITVDVLANDTDEDNDNLSISGAMVLAGLGSVSIVNNELVWDPGTDFDYLNEGETALVDIEYTVDDGNGGTDTATTTVTVTGSSDGPPPPPIEIDSTHILTAGSDVFWGAALNTRVDGLGGNDTIAGDASQIYDGRGPSPVRYMGDDWLNGGEGADTVYGDARHMFSYRSWYKNPTFEAGDDYIYGGEGNDYLYGDARDVSADANNYGGFNMLGGDDFMSGDAGSDFMVGDFNRITITARNGVWNVEGGDDTINGGDGSDTIYGDFNYVYVSTYRGSGSATIQNGDDRINGGAGNDHMWGDTRAYNLRSQTTVTNGADTFVFNDDSGHDYIRDFQSGLDTIEVDGYGLTDFSQLTITESNGSSVVYFDVDNRVQVVGVTGLDADDFSFV